MVVVVVVVVVAAAEEEEVGVAAYRLIPMECFHVLPLGMSVDYPNVN
jgi:hypothetical protein